MIRRMIVTAGFAVVGFPAVASACAAHSDTVIQPGMAWTGGFVGFVLPILAAFLKRPLFSLAGVSGGALPLSLQSSLLAFFGVPIVGGAMLIGVQIAPSLFGVAFTGYVFGAPLLGALIDYSWARLRTHGRLKVWPFLVANVFAALFIALLPLYREILFVRAWGLGDANYGWVRENIGWVLPVVTLGAVLVYVLAFCRRTYTARISASTADRHFGFEVITTDDSEAGRVRPVKMA